MDATTARISGKIASGALPFSTHDSASLAHGHGKLCDGCDKAVAWANTEVLVGFTRGPALRFHVDCFGVWHAAARAATDIARTARPLGNAVLRSRT